MTSAVAPYVGPRPFEQTDAHLFFGREREANELVSLVTAHAVTVVFGKPGTGKTSLLSAQVLPQLEAEEFKVLPKVRFGRMMPWDTETKVSNIYVFNTLKAWSQNKASEMDLASISLSDFLLRYRDQSLELEPRIAVFDQFEELFLDAEHWQEREEFMMQIREALDNDRVLRVVFSMREESLGELDPYIHLLPDIMRIRFRLEPLRKRAALSALIEPLRSTDRRFEKAAAEQLVDDLLTIRIKTSDGWRGLIGQYVDAVHLQVVGQSLWDSLSPEEKTITRKHLMTFGDVDKSLIDFYEKAIASATRVVGVRQGSLRLWFEQSLITPTKTRGIVFRGKNDTAGIPNQVLDLLERQRIVRAELRGGGVWYELAHDRLIQPILDSNQSWLLSRSVTEQTRMRLESRAEDWLNHGRSPDLLLSEPALMEAELWIKSPEAEEGYSDQLFSLISASRAAVAERARELEFALAKEHELRINEQARNSRRLWTLAVLLALVSLIAFAAIVSLWMR
jgi:KaiC/GvpD/RAD55 family RecA-like ATPase